MYKHIAIIEALGLLLLWIALQEHVKAYKIALEIARKDLRLSEDMLLIERRERTAMVKDAREIQRIRQSLRLLVQ